MFPLTDLNVLFVTILVIAFICLGLLILLGITICKRFRENNPAIPPTPPTPTPLPTPPQTNQLKDVIDKLDSAKKEIVLGTNVAISSLAFAFAVYSTQTIFRNVLQGLVGIILAFIMLIIAYPNNRKWIHENFKRLRWLFYFILGILIIISILSVRFVYTIPAS
jgi:hypothetical protein